MFCRVFGKLLLYPHDLIKFSYCQHLTKGQTMKTRTSQAIETKRLLLRPWQQTDKLPFAALNADPMVMRWFPETLDRHASDKLADRISAHIDEHGFGLWAVEWPGKAPFLGFVGLSVPKFEAPFQPSVEIGWRLARPWWGKGIASEAAKASLDYGFRKLGLQRIVSFTASANCRSVAVMKRIGMTHRPELDFDHPLLSLGSPLRRHVLYAIDAPMFL